MVPYLSTIFASIIVGWFGCHLEASRWILSLVLLECLCLILASFETIPMFLPSILLKFYQVAVLGSLCLFGVLDRPRHLVLVLLAVSQRCLFLLLASSMHILEISCEYPLMKSERLNDCVTFSLLVLPYGLQTIQEPSWNRITSLALVLSLLLGQYTSLVYGLLGLGSCSLLYLMMVCQLCVCVTVLYSMTDRSREGAVLLLVQEDPQSWSDSGSGGSPLLSDTPSSSRTPSTQPSPRLGGSVLRVSNSSPESIRSSPPRSVGSPPPRSVESPLPRSVTSPQLIESPSQPPASPLWIEPHSSAALSGPDPTSLLYRAYLHLLTWIRRVYSGRISVATHLAQHIQHHEETRAIDSVGSTRSSESSLWQIMSSPSIHSFQSEPSTP